MVDLWAMVLLGKKPPESLWRLLVPLLTVIGIAVFGWLNEKAKQKEREQQSQEQAQGKREARGQASGAGRAQPRTQTLRQPEVARRAKPTQQIHRYQPQIPAAPRRVAQRQRPRVEEPELIVMAEDVGTEAVQAPFGQELRRLQAETIRRAKARRLRRIDSQARLETSQTVAKRVRKKPSEELPRKVVIPSAEISQPRATLVGAGRSIAVEQIRRAIVWSEILGAPRALRPLEQLF